MIAISPFIARASSICKDSTALRVVSGEKRAWGLTIPRRIPSYLASAALALPIRET
jgi:hypothetical protein